MYGTTVNDNPSGDVPISSTGDIPFSSTKPEARKFVPTRVVVKLTGFGGLLLLVYFALTAYNQNSVSSAPDPFALTKEQALLMNAPIVTDEFFTTGHSFTMPLWGQLPELIIPGGLSKRCGRSDLMYVVWHHDADGNLLTVYQLIIYPDFRFDVSIQMPVNHATGHTFKFWSGNCYVVDALKLRPGSRGPVTQHFTVHKGKLNDINIGANRRALIGKRKSDGLGLHDIVIFQDSKEDSLALVRIFLPPGNRIDERGPAFGIRNKDSFKATHFLQFPDNADLNLYVDQVNTMWS